MGPRLALLVLALAALRVAGAGRAAAADDGPPPAPPPQPAAGPEDPPVSGFRFATNRRVKTAIDLSRLRNGGERADPTDCIPPIRKPLAVPRVEATHVRDDDPVVGVELDGEARAYPIAMLEAHEIVDDVLAATEIAVTYCPLCDSAVVYRRRLPAGKGVPDEALVFGCSGYLYDSDVLIYDDKTETFWQQLTGRGVVGPLTGTVLVQLPLRRTTMKAWEAAHPKTTVLSWRTEYGRPPHAYRMNPYGGYRASKQLQFPVAARDPRLPLKEHVVGLRLGDVDVAVPRSTLEGRADPLAFAVGDVEARVFAPDAAGEVRAERREKGEGAWAPAQGLECYWFAWFAFHPTTRVVAADGTVGPEALAPPAAGKEPAK